MLFSHVAMVIRYQSPVPPGPEPHRDSLSLDVGLMNDLEATARLGEVLA
jgi:hypothetical protein